MIFPKWQKEGAHEVATRRGGFQEEIVELSIRAKKRGRIVTLIRASCKVARKIIGISPIANFFVLAQA
jgi:hypothetical protein